MSRIARAIEHSISSTVAPDLEKDRLAKIKSLRIFPDRMGATALHHMIVANPGFARRVMNFMLTSSNLEYLSSGADSGVYRRGNEVVKIVRSTVALSEDERISLVEKRTAAYKELHTFMPKFTLDEQTLIDAHPLNQSWRVVQTLQPYCPFDPIDVFSCDKPTVNTKMLRSATQRYSGLEYALNEFVDNSTRYHESTGLYPDTNGVDNLVVSNLSTPELTLIDTGPIGQEHPAVQTLIARQLDSLKVALNEIS